jgi:hypothetical protein
MKRAGPLRPFTLTPNARRCLRDVRIHLRIAWQLLRSALRWQRRGY